MYNSKVIDGGAAQAPEGILRNFWEEFAMGRIYTSAEQLIGGTPLLELTRLERAEGLQARVLAKLESFNPGGSATIEQALSIALRMYKNLK